MNNINTRLEYVRARLIVENKKLDDLVAKTSMRFSPQLTPTLLETLAQSILVDTLKKEEFDLTF